MKCISAALLLIFGLGSLAGSVALASSSISYQGQLQRDGVPFDGQAEMHFQLFDRSSGGEAISSVVVIDPVDVRGGLFQVELNFGADVFGDRLHYLEIHVDEQLLDPRQVIRPVPVARYALASRQVDADAGFGVRCQGGGRLIGMRDDALPLCSLQSVHQVDAGGEHSCAVQANGEVWCWGIDNAYGQLGDGTLQAAGRGAVQVRVDDAGSDGGPLTGAVRVGAGGSDGGGAHNCAVDDEGRAWCWGTDYRVGDGRTPVGNSVPRAVQVVNIVGSPIADAVDIAGGGDHSCLLRSNGTVLCWGRGSSGQLGNGSNDSQNRAVAVRRDDNDTELGNIVAISAGWEHSCALDGEGKLWCWGNNANGQVGTGSTSPSSVFRARPVMGAAGSELDQVDSVGTSRASTCATRSARGGEVLCWGSRSSGALGDGESSGNALYPVRVIVDDDGNDGEPLRGAVQVGGALTRSGGGNCAVRDDHTAWCWGTGSSGQLGNDVRQGSSRAVQVVRDLDGASGGPLRGASQVAVGQRHACATDEDGRVWCWGDNYNLGVGGLPVANAWTPRAMEATRRIEKVD